MNDCMLLLKDTHTGDDCSLSVLPPTWLFLTLVFQPRKQLSASTASVLLESLNKLETATGRTKTIQQPVGPPLKTTTPTIMVLVSSSSSSRPCCSNCCVRLVKSKACTLPSEPDKAVICSISTPPSALTSSPNMRHGTE